MLAAWRRAFIAPAADPGPRAAVGVARQVGAGRVLEGTISGTQRRLVVSASMLETVTGASVGRASVEGSLQEPGRARESPRRRAAGQAGGGRQRLTNMSALSLPAVRAYLDGQAALRQGRWDAAVQRFGAALDVDSTFAQAALGTRRSGRVGGGWRRREGWAVGLGPPRSAESGRPRAAAGASGAALSRALHHGRDDRGGRTGGEGDAGPAGGMVPPRRPLLPLGCRHRIVTRPAIGCDILPACDRARLGDHPHRTDRRAVDASVPDRRDGWRHGDGAPSQSSRSRGRQRTRQLPLARRMGLSRYQRHRGDARPLRRRAT